MSKQIKKKLAEIYGKELTRAEYQQLVGTALYKKLEKQVNGLEETEY